MNPSNFTTVLIRRSEPDCCEMAHTMDGRLVAVRRPSRPLGATVKDPEKFKRAMGMEDTLHMPSFLTGIFGGAMGAFLIVALVAFVAWCR